MVKKRNVKNSKNLSTKETREIIFMIGSVALVGLTAIFLLNLAPQQSQSTNFHGAASGLSADYPTYAGMLSLLEEMCYWQDSNGDTCDSVCEGFDQICLPLQETCNVGFIGQCRCCDYPR